MKLLPILFFTLTALFMGGCASTVDTGTVTHLITAKSQNQVRDTILEAGKARGWDMKTVSNGIITGHINVRGQQADIRVTYDIDIVNISYVSGSRSATNNLPPKKYTRWAQLLGKDIKNKLSPTLKN